MTFVYSVQIWDGLSWRVYGERFPFYSSFSRVLCVLVMLRSVTRASVRIQRYQVSGAYVDLSTAQVVFVSCGELVSFAYLLSTVALVWVVWAVLILGCLFVFGAG